MCGGLLVGKNFACLIGLPHWCSDSICYRLATYLLIMIMRFIGYTNTYIHKLCQKMADFRSVIAETGILCSMTSPRRQYKKRASRLASNQTAT